MATQYVKFSGPCEWAKVWPNQVDRAFADPDNPRDKGGHWSIKVKLNDEDQKTFNTIGSKAELNDGWVTFRCYEKASFGDVAPPVVKLPKGIEDGALIGNGSVVTVDTEIYDYSFKNRPGKGIRLKGVTVNEYVEYKRPDTAGEPAAKPDLNDPVPF